MPRHSSAALCVLLGSSAVLLACDLGSSYASSEADGGTAGASPSGGGAVGASGAAGSSGGGFFGGTPGTGTAGGPAGSSAGGVSGNGGSSAGSAGEPSSGGGSSGGGGGGGGNCGSALFCDDFESYVQAPALPWTVAKNEQGNVVVDGAQHKSGKQAVKLSTNGQMSYQKAFITLDKIFPVLNNAFYGRMQIYVTKAANDGVHWTMIQGEGVAAGGITNARVRYGGQHEQSLMANYDSSGKKSDCWQHSLTKMPEAKWACMEWYFDGASNTQKFWLDGKAIDDLTVKGQGEGCIAHDTADQWIFPTFSRLSLGWESYQADDAREVWIDDVALGTAQLGCQ